VVVDMASVIDQVLLEISELQDSAHRHFLYLVSKQGLRVESLSQGAFVSFVRIELQEGPDRVIEELFGTVLKHNEQYIA
jgi:hypothetical protein